MRIILSRKGFDSVYGGIPSPILAHSGEMHSLPIPECPPRAHSIIYGDITLGQRNAGKLIADLSGGRLGVSTYAHLDPDLSPGAAPRMPGWRPAFGQAGAAERHLQNSGVEAGDLFLFYGWFREVVHENGTYYYRERAPDLHVIFGWLQIAERLALDSYDQVPTWLRAHPHGQPPGYPSPDCLYIASTHLRLHDQEYDIPGGGMFQTYHPARQLTAPGNMRSIWRLPPWLYPQEDEPNLTYHRNKKRWTNGQEHTILRTVGRGQEFVLDCKRHPQAIDWVREIFQLNAPAASLT